MKYADFATQLQHPDDLELVFEFADTPIRRGYHLTEVMRVTVDAIDCGGAVDRWTETVLQLIEPRHDDASGFMNVGKFKEILKRSQAKMPLHVDSPLLLEFRSAGSSAAQRFHVTGVHAGVAGQLRVLSAGSDTQCKAAARSRSADGAKPAAGACYAPGPGADMSARTTGTCCAGDAAAGEGQSLQRQTPQRQPAQGCCV